MAIDIEEVFKKFSDMELEHNEYHEFDRVENKLSASADMHAFMLLDKLCPCERGRDMVAAAEHDVIYLRTDLEELSEVATEEDILTLVRCGVMYDDDNDCLMMFA